MLVLNLASSWQSQRFFSPAPDRSHLFHKRALYNPQLVQVLEQLVCWDLDLPKGAEGGFQFHDEDVLAEFLAEDRAEGEFGAAAALTGCPCRGTGGVERCYCPLQGSRCLVSLLQLWDPCCFGQSSVSSLLVIYIYI